MLGSNGARKTTAIKLLTTLPEPASGDTLIDGISIIKYLFKVRRLIGYVPQMISVDCTLTGYGNLLLFTKLYDIPSKEAKRRVWESLEFMNLTDHARKAVKTYFGRMIRKLKIAQSMLHRSN